MICPKCKREYRQGFVSCSYCKIPLIEKSKDIIVPSKKTRNTRWVEWVIGVGVFIIILGFIIIATLARGGTENLGGLGAAIGGLMLIGFGLCLLVVVLIIWLLTTIFSGKGRVSK